MTGLDEAISRYERWTEDAPELEALVDAARAYRDLLANGRRVEWCETHRREAPTTAHCDSSQHIAMEPCRIVSKLLSVYPKEAENEGVAVSLPVCPECDGLNEVGADGKKATRLNPAMGPCPACGGSGVDITGLVEAASRCIYDFDDIVPKPPYWSDLTEDMERWYRGAGRAVVLEVLRVLEEGTDGR